MQGIRNLRAKTEPTPVLGKGNTAVVDILADKARVARRSSYKETIVVSSHLQVDNW